MSYRTRLGVRWTMGDVDARGFEALRLSLCGAWRLFGPAADYAVCVNTLPIPVVRARIGPTPMPVRWIQADGQLPAWLRARFDDGLGEGMAWKFAPLRVFPDKHELSLDNDCILWGIPDALLAWLEGLRPSFLVAEDVRACFGQFSSLCGNAPRNLGIRGLPPGFDLERALRRLLAEFPDPLSSELDEQGMQLAVLQQSGPVHVVRVDDVTICSPFWPHRPELGRCGAHFVGLNARELPWRYYDRPATDCVDENWRSHLAELRHRVAIPGQDALTSV